MACLPPALTVTCAGGTSIPRSRAKCSAAACFSRAAPPTAVYFVSPASSAALAAAMTCGGVAKSGSPTDSEMMSRPASRRAMARSVMAVVPEGEILSSAAEMVSLIDRRRFQKEGCGDKTAQGVADGEAIREVIKAQFGLARATIRDHFCAQYAGQQAQ